MKIIDKVLFNRPSYKDMGIEDKVTKLVSSENILKRVRDNMETLANKEEVQRVLATEETTLATYDKVPQQIKGLVVHEQGSSDRMVIGVSYYNEMNQQEVIQSEDGKHVAKITADGITVSNLPELLRNNKLIDFLHDFDTRTIKEIVAPSNPPIRLAGKTIYLRGRIIAPTLVLKEKYKDVLVKGYYPLVGDLDSEVIIKPMDNTVTVHSTSQPKSEKSIDAHPIILHSMEVTKYLAEHSDVLETEMSKVTDEDKKRFETENAMRVVACKAILGEVKISL